MWHRKLNLPPYHCVCAFRQIRINFDSAVWKIVSRSRSTLRWEPLKSTFANIFLALKPTNFAHIWQVYLLLKLTSFHFQRRYDSLKSNINLKNNGRNATVGYRFRRPSLQSRMQDGTILLTLIFAPFFVPLVFMGFPRFQVKACSCISWANSRLKLRTVTSKRGSFRYP